MIFPGFPGVLSFFQVFKVFQVEWEPWVLYRAFNTTSKQGQGRHLLSPDPCPGAGQCDYTI